MLQWLSNLPGRWQTFVANRVAQIQEILPREGWLHVPTEQNPADLVSRGMPVADLLASELWWNGPSSLLERVICIPVQPTDEEISSCTDEEKKVESTSNRAQLIAVPFRVCSKS